MGWRSSSRSKDTQRAFPAQSSRPMDGGSPCLVSLLIFCCGVCFDGWLHVAADGTLSLWKSVDGTFVHTFHGHTIGISHVCWAPDSLFLCSARDDCTLRVWTLLDGGSLKALLEGHTHHVYTCAFSPQSNLIASGGYDESVRIWDVQSRKCIRVLPAHSDPVTGVAFSLDGTLIVSCSFDGLIRIWDTATGQCLKSLIDETNVPVSYVSFSPNSQFILASSLNSEIKLWSYATGKALREFRGHGNIKYSLATQFLSWPIGERRSQEEHQSQEYVLSGTEDGRLCGWDLQTARMAFSIPVHQGTPFFISADTGNIEENNKDDSTSFCS